MYIRYSSLGNPLNRENRKNFQNNKSLLVCRVGLLNNQHETSYYTRFLYHIVVAFKFCIYSTIEPSHMPI